MTNSEGYKAHIIIGGYFLMLPIFLALAYNNEHVSDVLRVRFASFNQVKIGIGGNYETNR